MMCSIGLLSIYVYYQLLLIHVCINCCLTVKINKVLLMSYVNHIWGLRSSVSYNVFNNLGIYN